MCGEGDCRSRTHHSSDTAMPRVLCTRPAAARVWALAALGLLTVLPQEACGMIHNLSVHRDARRVFQIESFGFRERGFMNLTVSSFSVGAFPVFIVWLFHFLFPCRSLAEEHHGPRAGAR